MLRTSFVGVALGALIAAPLAVALWLDVGLGDLMARSFLGLVAAVDAVGWVLIPQIMLATGILGLALQQLSCRVAGLSAPDSPSWLDPAVESALLLGMLGTISGMVSGFVGLSPEELQPGPLVHSLGTALRSSFVGFLIALVGVWAKQHPGGPRIAEVEIL